MRNTAIMTSLQRTMRLFVGIGLTASFLGCAATQTRESTGQYVDNSVITTKVKTAILEEPTLKSMQINVKTYDTKVQLSGFVDSAQSVAKAGEIAKGVPGVGSVQNDLIVK